MNIDEYTGIINTQEGILRNDNIRLKMLLVEASFSVFAHSISDNPEVALPAGELFDRIQRNIQPTPAAKGDE